MSVSGILFERAWLMLLGLAALELGLITAWSSRRSRPWARAVWAGLVVIPILVVLSILVVTSRERLIRLCREMAVLVDTGDVAAMRGYLADDFVTADMDRDTFLARVADTLSRYHVDRARLLSFEIKRRPDHEAVVMFNAICVVRSTDVFYDRVVSRWRLTFRHEGHRWHVTRIEAIPTRFSLIRDVADWLRWSKTPAVGAMPIIRRSRFGPG